MTDEKESRPAAGDSPGGPEESAGERGVGPVPDWPSPREREEEYTPPRVLVLDEGPSHRARRRRRIVLMVVAVAVLVAGLVQRDRLARWTEDSFAELRALVTSGPSPSSASEAGGTGTAPDTGGAATGAPTRPRPAPVRHLERLLDSLEVSVRRYRERHGDFQLGRLGCTGLVRGYAEVDRRFFAASRAYGEAGPETALEVAERYRRLSAVADSVNRVFDASGCERPE